MEGGTAFQNQELWEFCSAWGLNEDAQGKLLGLAPEAQAIVLREFSPPNSVHEHSGKFIMFAASVEKRMRSGLPRQPPPSGGGGKGLVGPNAIAPAEMCPPVRLQHPSPQARSRPALAEKVAGILATKRQRAHPVFPATSPLAAGSWEYGYGDWGDDGSWGTAPKRFKGMGKGKGVGFQCGGGVGGYHWGGSKGSAVWGGGHSDVTWANGCSSTGSYGASSSWGSMHSKGATGTISAWQPNPDAEFHIDSFVLQWGLNSDAAGKLRRLTPAALEVVLREFNPKGASPGGIDGTDWNGKLIAFATQVEKNLKSDSVAAFIARWNLNEDARTKLTTIPQEVLEIVLAEFHPPANAVECNGMLIKFAATVESRLRMEKLRGGFL